MLLTKWVVGMLTVELVVVEGRMPDAMIFACTAVGWSEQYSHRPDAQLMIMGR